MKVLLTSYTVHPELIRPLVPSSAEEEAQLEFWASPDYDVPRIVSEMQMLDVSNVGTVSTGSSAFPRREKTHKPEAEPDESEDDGGKTPAPIIRRIDGAEEMILSSSALLDPGSSRLFSSLPGERGSGGDNAVAETDLSENEYGGTNETGIPALISSLQREVLLLRNELAYEVWLGRENGRHVGRLYQERVVGRNVEAERQGLVIVIAYFPLLAHTPALAV